MNWVGVSGLVISVAAVSVVLYVFLFRVEPWRHVVAGAFAWLNIGLCFLFTWMLPRDAMRVLAQIVFISIAASFFKTAFELWRHDREVLRS